MKIDLQQILKETSKSVSNGHSVQQLEEWKILIKELEKEDKKSLGYAIKILETVIELKKNKSSKSKIFFFSAIFLFVIFSVYFTSSYPVTGLLKSEIEFDEDTYYGNFDMVGDLNVSGDGKFGGEVSANNFTIGDPYTLYEENGNLVISNGTTDLMIFNRTADEWVFTTNTRTMGFSEGASPLKLRQGVQFFNLAGAKGFSIYHAHGNEEWRNVSGIFNASVVFELDAKDNPYGMDWLMWDKITQRPPLVINFGAEGRATTFDRSLRIGRANNPIDENYTLCDNLNCNASDAADLEVEGSIWAGRNITADYFIGDELHIGDVRLDLSKYIMGTGILYGGIMTKNVSNNSWVDIEEGAGIFVNYTNLDNPEVEYFTWKNQTFYPNVNGFRSKWIGFEKNSSGDIEIIAQLDFTQEEKRTVAVLGRCISTDGLDTCNILGQYTTPAFGQMKSVEDLYYALGSLSIDGNIFSANGSNLLLDRSSGNTFRFSGSFKTSPQSPNIHYNEPSLGIINYAYHLQNSTTTTKELQIDPDNYDLNEVKTAVPTNKWTIQELWFFPVSRTTHVIYGQNTYSSQGDAIAAISSEVKEINEEILDGAIRRGYLIVQEGAIDLSDEDEAAFYEAGLDSAGGTYYWERDGAILRPAEFGDSVELGGDFTVNGNISANYFMGDGSQLTGISGGDTDKLISPDNLKNVTLTNTDLVYNDGTIERADFSAVHTKFYSPDGDYVSLDDSSFIYNDGTRHRLEMNAYVVALISSSGIKTLMLNNTGGFYNGKEIATVNDINPNWDTAYSWGDHDGLYSLLNHKEDTLISPDNDKSLNLTNDFLFYDDGVMNRFLISNIMSYFVSPNGMNYLIVNNTGAYANGEIILTTSDKYWTKNGNNLSYDGNLNVSNQLLVEETLSALLSPDGTKNLMVDNTGAFYNGGEILTVSNNPEHDKIISPDTLKNLTLTDSTLIYNDNVNNRILVNSVTSRLVSQGGAYISSGDTGSYINDGTRARLKIDGSDTILFSPSGTKFITLDNAGTTITGDVEINGESILNGRTEVTGYFVIDGLSTVIGDSVNFRMKAETAGQKSVMGWYKSDWSRIGWIGHGSGANYDLTIRNEGAGGNIQLMADSGVVYVNDYLKVSTLTGSGNDYVCVNSAGQMFRSSVGC